MKSLMELWSNSAKVINATGVEEIIKTIKAFDGYWSENDLNKFLNIVQTLQNRNNIKPNSGLSRKLNVLRGEFRGKLPNNGSPSRSGRKRTRSNGKNPTTLVNNSRQPTPPAPSTNNAAKRRSNGNGNKSTTLVNNSRQPTPPTPQLKTAAMGAAQMNVNNSTKRKTNLNAYINALQRNLKNKGVNHNFNKPFWLNKLSGNNTNSRLKIIKDQLKGIYNIQQG